MLNMKSKIFKYIYAMLCLLPAIAVGVTCVYVANNDNAFESYSGNTAQPTTYVETSITDFNVGDYVYYTSVNQPLIQRAGSDMIIYCNDVFFNGTTRYETADNIVFYAYPASPNSTTLTVNIRHGTDTLYSNSGLLDRNVFLTFQFLSYNSGQVGQNYLDGLTFYEVQYNDFGTLDNVFYYSLDKVENSNVFSWVKSNFLYSGVNQFVGIFGGTNSNISFYLTWVLTISLCYLGFEVLMLFINMARNLIHSFTDKERW